TLELECAGWRVVRVWEHDIFENLSFVLSRISRALTLKRWRRSALRRVVLVTPIDETGCLERRTLRDLRAPHPTLVVRRLRTTGKWALPKKEISKTQGA